jgi:regulatory protein
MSLLGFNEIKSKLERFCAYQERSPYEVKKKLASFTSDSKQIDGVLSSLIEEGFLNQERFVELYVLGKTNQKLWGKLKIKNGLIQNRIPADVIQDALNSIDLEKYRNNIETLAVKKIRGLKKEASSYEKKSKVLRFLSSKGYTLGDCEDLDFDDLFSS